MQQLHAFRRSTWWIWNLSIWLGIGLFSATQNVVVMRSEGMHHDWMALFTTLTLSWLPWAFATPVVLRLGQSHSLGTAFGWVVHASALAVIAIAIAAWVAFLAKLLNPWGAPDSSTFVSLWRHRFFTGLLQSTFLYSVILGTSYLLASRDRLLLQEAEKSRLSEQLAKAQLNSLRRQIEPHFLFNTLNSIAAQIRDAKNEEAVEMISALGDVLRAVIDDSNRQETSLGKEIELLRKYLDIQKVRFGDRLQVDMQIPAHLLSAVVPSFFLQPVVENSLQHGIAKRGQGGALRISATGLDGYLTLTIYNDGPPLKKRDTGLAGVGLPNLKNRLEGLYGESYKFSIHNKDSSGVEVSISLPFRES